MLPAWVHNHDDDIAHLYATQQRCTLYRVSSVSPQVSTRATAAWLSTSTHLQLAVPRKLVEIQGEGGQVRGQAAHAGLWAVLLGRLLLLLLLLRISCFKGQVLACRNRSIDDHLLSRDLV